jgi:UDP-glucuronate 4-epimerase
VNVLLTGAAGLIGMALRPTLAAAGHKVTSVDITDFGRGDAELQLVPLDDRAPLDALIRRARIDAIVHCGAISGPMMARGEPLKLVAANIDATALLLDLARARDAAVRVLLVDQCVRRCRRRRDRRSHAAAPQLGLRRDQGRL